MPNLSTFAQWIADFFLYIPRQIFSLFTDGMVSIINSIMPNLNSSSITSAWAQIPSGVLYLVGWFQLGQGITALLAAYSIRFIIRRLPVVG